MKKGVVFRFLDQPELNSEGKYIDFLLTVLAAVAQLERDILDEKRREGIHDVLGLVPQPARAPFSSAASPSNSGKNVSKWTDGPFDTEVKARDAKPAIEKL